MNKSTNVCLHLEALSCIVFSWSQFPAIPPNHRTRRPDGQTRLSCTRPESQPAQRLEAYPHHELLVGG